jgi:hypothetical protein
MMCASHMMLPSAMMLALTGTHHFPKEQKKAG